MAFAISGARAMTAFRKPSAGSTLAKPMRPVSSARNVRPEETRQPPGEAVFSDEASPRIRKSHPRACGHVPDVAVQAQAHANARSRAVDGCDQRLAKAQDVAIALDDVLIGTCRRGDGRALTHASHVGACAEGTARACQNETVDVGILIGAHEQDAQRRLERRRPGIHALGPIYLEDRHAVRDRVIHLTICQDVSPLVSNRTICSRV
nr:hypothetical protein [Variovorax sp.]